MRVSIYGGKGAACLQEYVELQGTEFSLDAKSVLATKGFSAFNGNGGFFIEFTRASCLYLESDESVPCPPIPSV